MNKIAKVIKYLREPRLIIVFPKGKRGMDTSDLRTVLKVLKEAERSRKIPVFGYSHDKTNWHIYGKAPLYLEPKHANLRRTAVQIRTIIRQKFGDKYSVRLTGI